MKGKPTSSDEKRESLLGPVKRKTPKAGFMQFFEQQFPAMGEISRAAVVDQLLLKIDEYYPKNEHMQMGTMLWYGVDKNETSSYGKSIEKCKIKPVLLDIITEHDIIKLISGTKKKEIKKEIEVRLFGQSDKQGATLSCSDVATMMNLSPATIARHIREYEKETNEVVPRRGTVHDLGPTITHKKAILYKFIVEGKTVEKVANETNHSPAAITRYVKDYKRISACLAQKLPDDIVSYVTRTSKKLVLEYKKLIEENNIEITKNDVFDSLEPF